MCRHARLLLPLLLSLLFAATINAVPLSEQVVAKLRNEGRLDEVEARINDARARGVDMPQTVNRKTRASLARAQRIPSFFQAWLKYMSSPISSHSG
jgi:hypothetical protein